MLVIPVRLALGTRDHSYRADGAMDFQRAVPAYSVTRDQTYLKCATRFRGRVAGKT